MIVKNVEKKENNTATFQVGIDAAEFEKAINSVYLKNKKNLYVPGFRKGKVSRMVVEGMYGSDVFYDDAINELAPVAFEFAVEQEKLDSVGRPSLLDMQVADDKSVTLYFETALYPVVTLGEYKGLEVAKEKVVISDEEVEAELKRIQKRNARIQTVERAAQKGDTANIDFEGFENGVPFEGGKGEGFNLVLGSQSFVPGFEEQVEGMSAGEEKDIDITFPEDYNEEFAGKAVVFHIKCNEVKESILPELDDEFAKDVSEFDTLEAYKEDLRAKQAESRSRNVERAFREDVLTKAAENMQVEIPEAMLEEQHEIMINEYAQNLASQGMELGQYLAMMGTDINTFRQNTRPGAARQLKINLMLDAVAKAEGIEITDEDVEAELQKLAEAYNMDLESVRKAVPAESLRKDLTERKAADLVCDSAVATEPVAEEKKEDEAE